MIGHLLEKARDVFDCDVNLLGDKDSCDAADLNLVSVEGVWRKFCLLQKNMWHHIQNIYKAGVAMACCWQNANE